MDRQELSQLSPSKIYNTYIEQIDPEILLAQGKTAIVDWLIREKALDDQVASYAAEQILVYAQELIDSRSTGIPPEEENS
jgi:hypothetical protein